MGREMRAARQAAFYGHFRRHETAFMREAMKRLEWA
jgi:hypothetical protein